MTEQLTLDFGDDMTMQTPITEWSEEHGPSLVHWGRKAIKKPNPVYLFQVQHDGTVKTNEGDLAVRAGDFVAHDPISGHVWPVAASYVEQHYDFEEQQA